MDKNLKITITLVSLAIVALLFGVTVYLIDRHADAVYFVPKWMVVSNNPQSVFGFIGQHIPTFVHVYAFILLTLVVVTNPQGYRRYILPICLFWLALDGLFEIAQIKSIGAWIANHTPQWFNGIPFLENTSDYFLSSTFDIADLISILLGAMAAYFTVIFITRTSICEKNKT